MDRKGKKKFSRKHGFHSKMNAQIVGEEIERLQKKHGIKFNAETFVNESKPVNAPCHGCFEWDDSIAGHNWRVHQGRNEIASIEVTYLDGPEHKAIPASLWVREPEPGEPGAYIPSFEAMSREDWAKQVEQEAKQYFLAGKERYRDVTGMAEIFAAIDAYVSKSAAKAPKKSKVKPTKSKRRQPVAV